VTEGVLFKCVNQRVFVATSNLERAAPIMDAVDGFHFLDAQRYLLAISDQDIEERNLRAVREALLEKCENLQRQVDEVAEQLGLTRARANTMGWTWSTCWLQQMDFEAIRTPL
jgi:hypothetical protein